MTVVESTVDDLDPRLWPSVLQAVRAAGAWDCWCTPMVGRHGRPGQVLTALCAEPVLRAVTAAIFAHTGTLGVRWSRMNRLTASRTSVEVEVGPPGSNQVVTVKVADTTDGLAGLGTATAELAEAEAAARALGWPVRAVCEAAVAQYRAQAAVPRLHGDAMCSAIAGGLPILVGDWAVTARGANRQPLKLWIDRSATRSNLTSRGRDRAQRRLRLAAARS